MSAYYIKYIKHVRWNPTNECMQLHFFQIYFKYFYPVKWQLINASHGCGLTFEILLWRYRRGQIFCKFIFKAFQYKEASSKFFISEKIGHFLLWRLCCVLPGYITQNYALFSHDVSLSAVGHYVNSKWKHDLRSI